MSDTPPRELLEKAAEIERERQRREASRNLLAYAQWINPTYRIGFPHRKVAEALMMVEAGLIDRLMIIMPPRHGKSLLTSRIFPAWYLGRNPTRQVMGWAYGGELAEAHGGEARKIVGSAEHREVFGERAGLSHTTKGRALWQTNSGGVYRSAGEGGAVTGFGAHLLIIDDPVKGRAAAYSTTIQEQTWGVYRSDLYTRLMKNSAVILIQTRWVEIDLAGRLLAEQEKDGDKWHVVYFPASRHRLTGKPVPPTDENAIALWEEDFPLSTLERTRRVVTAIPWQSEYQGDPMPESGDFYQADWLQTYDEEPDISRLRIYGASDYAVTHDGGDYTVHVVVGVDSGMDIFVLDMWREQTSSDIWVEKWLDMVRDRKPLLWAEEGGQIRRSMGPYMTRRQNERRIWCTRRSFSVAKDKPTRARSFQARCSNRKVYFPERKSWWPTMRQELLRFPGGKNDDIVDALSLIGMMLDVQTAGKDPPLPQDEVPVLTVGKRGVPPGMRLVTWNEITKASDAHQRRRRRARA